MLESSLTRFVTSLSRARTAGNMGLIDILGDAYKALDAGLGGYLPGGVTPEQHEVQEGLTDIVSGAGATGGFSTGYGTGTSKALGGRTMTLVVKQLPNGKFSAVKAVPGGVALFSRDFSSYRRVVKFARRFARRYRHYSPRPAVKYCKSR